MTIRYRMLLLLCFQNLVSVLMAFNIQNNGLVVQRKSLDTSLNLSSQIGGDSSSKLEGILTANSIYFDIEITGIEVGRLIFHLANPSPLPMHAENIIQLAKGSRQGIDPKATYKGCEFDFTPAAIEDGMGRYRWGHQCNGRGRNGVGKSDEVIVDITSQQNSIHKCFGGQYYGMLYEDNPEDPGVMLTVPIVGPGCGGSKFSIVRVGESPQEWKERLLLNAGVIGRLDPSSLEVLQMMARQNSGPPIIVASGAIE